MKKLLKFGILFCCLFFLSVPVKAEEDLVMESYIPKGDLQEGQYGTPEDSRQGNKKSRDATAAELASRYEQAVLNRETRVSISDLGISTWTINERLSKMRNQFPALFYASPHQYSFSNYTKLVNYFTIKYTAGEKEIAAYEAAVAEGLAQVSDDMSDVNKALVLHDYLALNCAYDYENLESDTLPDTVYQSYGALVLNSAVCQGYALAYQDLLERSGIPCVTVGSDAMNHAWNILELDGSYYHVDVTWDDPTWDTLGQVFHDYFLLSDDTIRDEDHKHYAWDADVLAVDTQHEDGFWRDSMSGIFQNEGYLYYINYNGELKKRTMDNGGETVLTKITDTWPNMGKTSFARLALANDRLYFNGRTDIGSIGLDGTGLALLEQPDTFGALIYGIALQDEQLLYHVRTSPSEKEPGTYGRVNNFTFLVNGFALNKSNLRVKEGESSSLYAVSLPNRRLYEGVSWNSSNQSAAAVNAAGLVTGRVGGTAVLTAADASGNRASCQVQVDHLSTVGVVEKQANCTQKGIRAFRCSGCGQVVSRQDILVNNQHPYGKWKTVKASTIFAAGKKTRTCTLCGESESQKISKEKAKVKLSAKAAPLQVKKTTSAICITSYSKGDKIAGWKSSNSKIVSVNKKTGKITGKKEGKAAITVTMKSGAKAKCKITVQSQSVRTEKVKLNKKKITLKAGKTFALKVRRTPVTAKEKITYRCSSSKIASVNNKGLVRGKKKGTAYITAKSSNGKMASCKVTVK